jgi:hypothetical protein
VICEEVLMSARAVFWSLIPALYFLSSAAAQETAPPLPFDSPVSMRDMEAVCTGIGADARNDPRWAAYPLRVELVGRAGEYLGEALVTLSKGSEAIIGVRCGGPWLLLKVPPGSYDVKAEVEGRSMNSRATVGTTGQARVVLRFPELGQPLK